MNSIKKLAVVGVLVGFLGVGGAAIAQAQTDDSTPSTTVPEESPAPAPPDDSVTPSQDPNCPNMGGDSQGPAGAADGIQPPDASASSLQPSSL